MMMNLMERIVMDLCYVSTSVCYIQPAFHLLQYVFSCVFVFISDVHILKISLAFLTKFFTVGNVQAMLDNFLPYNINVVFLNCCCALVMGHRIIVQQWILKIKERLLRVEMSKPQSCKIDKNRLNFVSLFLPIFY